MKTRITRVVAATALAPLAIVPAPPVSADDGAPRQCRTSFFGVTQPSLPNCLATVAGDCRGIFADCSAGDTCAPAELVPDAGDATASAALVPAERHTVATTGHSFIDCNVVDPLEAGSYW